MNFNLVAIYYNKGALNLFRINVNVTTYNLKDQLDRLNRLINHHNKRWLVNVEYLRSSTDTNGCVWFTNVQLQNNNDMIIMFLIFE